MEICESVVDFISTILTRDDVSDTVTVYRGHENASYVLKPAVFRSKENLECEHDNLRELIAASPADFSSDHGTLELLVRMQHYSLPTRLLDVSFNPLVSLYFACQPKKKSVRVHVDGALKIRRVEADGEVVAIRVPKIQSRYFDSDTVTCLTNLSRLDYLFKKDIDTELDIDLFNRTLPIKRLLHFIRQERPFFEPEIVPHHLNQIILVKPKKNNRRIIAQDGAFFVFGLNEEIDPQFSILKINRIKIPANHKDKILRELDKIAINEKTLFPELDRVAQYIAKNLARK